MTKQFKCVRSTDHADVYSHVSARELVTAFGADDDAAVRARSGHPTVIRRNEVCKTEAAYDRWTGLYEVTVWR